jgi:SAM-dependent methyltransferase
MTAAEAPAVCELIASSFREFVAPELALPARGDRILDPGCGNGGIAEYISDTTSARVSGVDFIPEAIRQAPERTTAKRSLLAFREGNIPALDFPASGFDAVVAIHTPYFTELERSIPQMADYNCRMGFAAQSIGRLPTPTGNSNLSRFGRARGT